MNAYLVAGLIVGGLAWVLTRRSGIAGIVLPLAVGVIGAGVGGTVANVAHGAGVRHVDAFGFTTAVLVAVLALAWVQVRWGREG
jgi:uncharacterized membrane protein YeaQ/YmgE (transglycosylase-associated protein family)